MKFIVDAQLPPVLAVWLREQGHQAEHVAEVGLRDADDSPIWHYALKQAACVLTKDEDFCKPRPAQREGSGNCLVAHRQLFEPGLARMVFSGAAGRVAGD